MRNIFFTSIGRRNQLARSFKKNGWTVFGGDFNPDECAAQEVVQQIFKLPLSSESTYYDYLLDVCVRAKIDCLVPLYEPELTGFAERKITYKMQGVEVIVSSRKTLDLCLDKYNLSIFLGENGFLAPETFISLTEINGESKWIVKPRSGMGGKDVQLADHDDAPFYFRKIKNPIVQRYIRGQEYSIDVFVSENGQVFSVVPRLRLEVRGGEVSKSVTVEDMEITIQTVNLVKKLGIYGPATIQGIREAATGKFYFIEVNPRFGGGVPLSIQAGIPYAEFLKEGYRQEPGVLHPYQVGLKMLRYDEAIFVPEQGSRDHGRRIF